MDLIWNTFETKWVIMFIRELWLNILSCSEHGFVASRTEKLGMNILIIFISYLYLIYSFSHYISNWSYHHFPIIFD